jgi:hypothetical protein
MDNDANLAEGERSSTRPGGILRSNVDDLRFTDTAHEPDKRAEWSAASSVAADLPEQHEVAGGIGEAGLYALVESGLQAALEAVGSLLSH